MKKLVLLLAFLASGVQAQESLYTEVFDERMSNLTLKAGECTQIEFTMLGTLKNMAVAVSPSKYPGDKLIWQAYVSGDNLVTLSLCALADTKPQPTSYNVRAIL